MGRLRREREQRFTDNALRAEGSSDRGRQADERAIRSRQGFGIKDGRAGCPADQDRALLEPGNRIDDVADAKRERGQLAHSDSRKPSESLLDISAIEAAAVSQGEGDDLPHRIAEYLLDGRIGCARQDRLAPAFVACLDLGCPLDRLWEVLGQIARDFAGARGGEFDDDGRGLCPRRRREQLAVVTVGNQKVIFAGVGRVNRPPERPTSLKPAMGSRSRSATSQASCVADSMRSASAGWVSPSTKAPAAARNRQASRLVPNSARPALRISSAAPGE